MRPHIPAAVLASMSGALVVVLAWAGSRGFRDFDSALIGYFVALVVATAAIVYRYSLWILRPPTWRYFSAGWRNFLSWRNFRRYTFFIPAALWHDIIGQTFIWKRGVRRWVAHAAIFWGVVVSLLVTVPLTLGWLRFTLVPPDTYQVWVSGLPVFRFPIEAGTGFAIFHVLDFAAVLVVVGVGMAFWRRLSDLGQLATQRFAFDLMPLVLLLAIAATGLALTASSAWWGGRHYWFISLVHQLVVVGWLLSLPFGKFFHIVQRPASIGVKLYQAVNQDVEHYGPRPQTGHCRKCGEPLPSPQFIADLQATLKDLRQDYDLGGDRGTLQEYCPTCKRLLRAEACYQMLGRRFL